MEIEENAYRSRFKRPETKPTPPSLRPEPKKRGRPLNITKKDSLKKIPSNDQVDPINRIEDMIQVIQSFPKRRKNADKAECKFCHSCKTQCEKIYLLHCSIQDCFLYYCLRCVNQKFRLSLNKISKIMKSEVWSCPSCLGECTCQMCQFKTSLDHITKTTRNGNLPKKKMAKLSKEQINLVENSSTDNESVQAKKEKTKKPLAKSELADEISPDLARNNARLSRKLTTNSKDELLKTRKKVVFSPIDSPIANKKKPKQLTITEKSKETKKKVAKMTVGGAEKWTLLEKSSSEKSEMSPKKETPKSKIPPRLLPPVKKNPKKRDSSPSVEDASGDSYQPPQLEEITPEKSFSPQSKKEMPKSKILSKYLPGIKKNGKKRDSSSSVEEKLGNSYHPPAKKSKNPSSFEPKKETSKSKILAKYLPATKKNAKNRDSSPSVDRGSNGSFELPESLRPEPKRETKSKIAAKYLPPIKKKRDSSPSVDEEFGDFYKTPRNGVTNSKPPNKKLLKPSLTKPGSKMEKPPKEPKKKKEASKSIRKKDDELEDLEAEMKVGGQQRRMPTRKAKKPLPKKTMASTDSESEKSYGSFEIKKVTEEVKTTKPKQQQRKDEWNENNKRVLHISSGGEDEFMLEREEDDINGNPVIDQELSPKRKEEKISMEVSLCHYCMEMKLEGMTCCIKSCHLFFCSICLRKHPDEDSKVSDVRTWRCLVCEDKCTCIDCLKVQFHPKALKQDIPNPNNGNGFQEYVSRFKQNRNDTLLNENLGLLDDKLEDYTLKKKKDNEFEVMNSGEENKGIPEPQFQETLLVPSPTMNDLTGMFSENNPLIDGIVDVDECQWYLAQSVSHNN